MAGKELNFRIELVEVEEGGADNCGKNPGTSGAGTYTKEGINLPLNLETVLNKEARS